VFTPRSCELQGISLLFQPRGWEGLSQLISSLRSNRESTGLVRRPGSEASVRASGQRHEVYSLCPNNSLRYANPIKFDVIRERARKLAVTTEVLIVRSSFPNPYLDDPTQARRGTVDTEASCARRGFTPFRYKAGPGTVAGMWGNPVPHPDALSNFANGIFCV